MACHCWQVNKQRYLFGNDFLWPWYTDTRLFRTIDRIRSETKIRDQGLARDQVYKFNPEPLVEQLNPSSILDGYDMLCILNSINFVEDLKQVEQQK